MSNPSGKKTPTSKIVKSLIVKIGFSSCYIILFNIVHPFRSNLTPEFIEENTSLSKSDILNFNENLGNYSNEIKKTGQNGILNIYDLAGNASEWTLEGGTQTSRGGNYSNKGSIASSIQYNDSKIFDKSVGFRIMMIK